MAEESERALPCLGTALGYSTMALTHGRRPVRIAGCSGSATDRRNAMRDIAANYPNDPVDVIIGDWMSEANMTARAIDKVTDGEASAAYERTFLEAFEPALPFLAKHGIKLAVNAGASDTERLHADVRKMIQAAGLNLRTAWVSGDEVFPAIQKARREGNAMFENICTGETLNDWKHEPIYAQAYLGGLGIAAAFEQGADVVVCGRVSDASPVIGAAYWWHSWERNQLDQLANAFVAGHLIECSTYVTGGNFTGFKSLEALNWTDLGFPIAEIAEDGKVVITKQKGTGGEVSTQTCASQLLYEIQGPWYFNSDVTAILTDVWFEQLGTNKVALRGVRGDYPPPTTKVGLSAVGGYQAEAHWFLCGLDIEAKARMMEAQIRHLLAPYSSNFTTLSFTLNGSAAPNPKNQNAATVDFRIFVQAPTAAAISPQRFLRPCIDVIMQGYPGATFDLDLRQGTPKPYHEYYVTLLPQSEVNHRVHFPDNRIIDMSPPPATKTYPSQQPSKPVASGIAPDFGPTTPGPLGWLVHARSGDKGSNANVGFWVRHRDEWDWLRHLLSVEKIHRLLGEEHDYNISKTTGKPKERKTDRFELPNLRAVHFLLHDHLDRGVSATSSRDFLGKNVAEFLRARYVDLPMRFLNRGRL